MTGALFSLAGGAEALPTTQRLPFVDDNVLWVPANDVIELDGFIFKRLGIRTDLVGSETHEIKCAEENLTTIQKTVKIPDWLAEWEAQWEPRDEPV